MGVISAAQAVIYGDKMTALWLAGLGTDGSGFGLGTVGASARAYGKAGDIQTAVLATSDVDQIVRLLSGAQAMQSALDASTALGSAVTAFMKALDEACRQAGIANVSDLNSFLTYYNITAGTKWQALMAPDFRDLYYAWKKSYPTAYNVYFEVLQGATYTNGLRKLIVGGAQTAGQDIDSTKYAGGYGQVKASGVTGADTVTVAGSWRKTDGTVATGNGTAAVSGNDTVVLTPPFTDALLLAVTGITVGASLTAATIYAEAKRPAARTNPPT